MTESRIPAVRQIGATLWAREVAPLREFLRTESGSAGVLLAATVAALVWVNIDARSYESFWGTTLSVRLGDARPVPDLRELGQQRPDDVLLPGRGGWRRGASSTWASCASAAASCCRWRPGWAGWSSRSLIYLAVNHGRPGGARLGHGDVHRHRVRPGRAGPGRPRRARPGARLPAHRSRRRRPGRARRHRRGLQRARCTRCRWSSACCLLAFEAAAAVPRIRFGALLPADRAWPPGSPGLRVRPRPGRRRPGHRPAGLRPYPPPARTWSRPPACSGCSASSPRPSWPGRRPRACTPRCRPTTRLQAALPPLDQLRHRPAVRAGQRRHRASTAASWPTPTPRRSRSASCVGYVVGKPLGDRRHVLALVTRLSRGRVAAAGRLGRGGRQRHASPASASPSRCSSPPCAFHGDAAGRGQARCRCPRSLVVVGADLGRLPAHRAAAAGRRARALLGTSQQHLDLVRAGRPGARPHPRARRTRR